MKSKPIKFKPMKFKRFCLYTDVLFDDPTSSDSTWETTSTTRICEMPIDMTRVDVMHYGEFLLSNGFAHSYAITHTV